MSRQSEETHPVVTFVLGGGTTVHAFEDPVLDQDYWGDQVWRYKRNNGTVVEIPARQVVCYRWRSEEDRLRVRTVRF